MFLLPGFALFLFPFSSFSSLNQPKPNLGTGGEKARTARGTCAASWSKSKPISRLQAALQAVIAYWASSTLFKSPARVSQSNCARATRRATRTWNAFGATGERALLVAAILLSLILNVRAELIELRPPDHSGIPHLKRAWEPGKSCRTNAQCSISRTTHFTGHWPLRSVGLSVSCFPILSNLAHPPPFYRTVPDTGMSWCGVHRRGRISARTSCTDIRDAWLPRTTGDSCPATYVWQQGSPTWRCGA